MLFGIHQLISTANSSLLEWNWARLAVLISCVDPKWPPRFDFLFNGITFQHYFYVKTIEMWVPAFFKRNNSYVATLQIFCFLLWFLKLNMKKFSWTFSKSGLFCQTFFPFWGHSKFELFYDFDWLTCLRLCMVLYMSFIFRLLGVESHWFFSRSLWWPYYYVVRQSKIWLCSEMRPFCLGNTQLLCFSRTRCETAIFIYLKIEQTYGVWLERAMRDVVCWFGTMCVDNIF